MVSALDALILCGGLGTRLRPLIADRPKGLAEIRGQPFLDLLIARLLKRGLSRFILCAGYGGAQIAEHYARRNDAEFRVSLETRPLGTGGAVRHALPQVRSEPFLVLNGDSYCDVDYAELLRFHQNKCAVLSIVVVPPASPRSDVGTIALAGDLAVTVFSEKQAGGGHRYVNAGIYLMQRAVVDALPADTAASLEREIFPLAVARGGCYGFPVTGPLVDIGTPERYLAAQELLRDP